MQNRRSRLRRPLSQLLHTRDKARLPELRRRNTRQLRELRRRRFLARDVHRHMQRHLDDMLTHKFPLEKYRELIEVNVNKGAHQAMKTAFSFE